MGEDTNTVTGELLYDKFVAAPDINETLESFSKLCNLLDINTKNHKTIFLSLKGKLKSWKCQSLFNKLEKRSKHVDYKNKPCAKNKILIIGAGPVGLRTAVECAFLGAHVVVIEKRDTFSRNNVLHLWPFLIVDLKSIGVKSFFGKFCAGSLDHISIKRLQLILLKISLFLGVQFYVQTMFLDIVQPSEGKGWRGKFKPESSPVNAMEFDAMVGCDGKYNCLKFKRKEFRGKLAIAITCNFKNKQTSEEAGVEEISGVAFIYNQEFFHELTQKTGIELENVLYYRDETHYFVMTAKKKSLLNKGVIKQDCKDAFKLLSQDNVSHSALLDYAKQAADFSTNYQLPHHEFARNHYNKEDVAMFDFTSIHQAESASRIYERKGKRLLLCIAGDVLLEPFWPTGSGCARGFLGAFDAAWMIRGLGLGRESLDLLQERESIFQLLPQTKPDALIRKHDLYSINPSTRYLNLNARAMKKEQVSHLLNASDSSVKLEEWASKNQLKNTQSKPIKVKKEKEVDPDTLLKWCKEQTAMYPKVKVVDMSRSWQNGMAFCAIIHRYRPNLLDYHKLDPENSKANLEKAFEIAEEHFGIPPKIAARDLARQRVPDTLTIMAYVSLYYEALKQEIPVSSPIPNEKEQVHEIDENHAENEEVLKAHGKGRTSKMAILSRLSKRSKKSKLVRKSKKDKESKDLTEQDGITLKSYSTCDIDTIKEISSDHSEDEASITKINVNSLVTRTPSPNSNDSSKVSNRDAVAARNQKNDEMVALRNEDNEIGATQSGNRFKRISQLAESVFGDTIVQQPSPNTPHKSITRKDSSASLIESEKCHFCGRKVYVAERQSAEGLFFHRSCFRCCVCKCRLLFGNYAYYGNDDDEGVVGKFYCKVHYNSLIYEEPKKKEESTQQKLVPKLNSDKRRRAFTQQIQKSDVRQAVRNQGSDDLQLSPKFTTQVRDVQKKLKENLPQLEVSKDKKKPYLTTPKLQIDDVDGNEEHEHKGEGESEEDLIQNPYGRFTPRSLLDRHPSLLRCSPQKSQNVTTTSSLSSSKFSVSTPNLTKLIQEDSMFEEERKKHEEKLNASAKKRIALGSELGQNVETTSYRIKNKKKLTLSDDLKSEINEENKRVKNKENYQDIYGSEEYRERFQSYVVSRDNSFGAVQRRPDAEKRAQYPVSMAFTDGLLATGFKPVAVEIDLDTLEPGKETTVVEEGKGNGKKKKLLLKKKKAKKDVDKEIENKEVHGEKAQSSPNRNPKALSSEKLQTKKHPATKEDSDDNWVMIPKSAVSPPHSSKSAAGEEYLFDSSSSSEGEDEKNSTLFRRAFGKKQKKLSKEQREMLEKKRMRKEQKNIDKELKERQSKRLWEAQSIQRKLNEVDVKMLDLDERANQVEKELRNGETKPAETNKLTLEWFNIVNEKNTLLRFESELVIQSNSIQLEDRQDRLGQKISAMLSAEDHRSNSQEIERLTKELVDTVEQRNQLVEMLEEDRLRELEEDKSIKDVFAQKAHAFGMDRLI